MHSFPNNFPKDHNLDIHSTKIRIEKLSTQKWFESRKWKRHQQTEKRVFRSEKRVLQKDGWYADQRIEDDEQMDHWKREDHPSNWESKTWYHTREMHEKESYETKLNEERR